MERDVDGVLAHLEELPDLPRAEVRAVPQRDEVALALVESRDGVGHGEPAEDVGLEVARGGEVVVERGRRDAAGGDGR